jgi:acetylornithine deacetylase/succinyl-diaminopimelate desuccinylase-like protein
MIPTVTDPFAGLEPAAFWRHFEALTKIPRATYEEERAVAHVVAWAAERGSVTRRDGAGNLVVDVPATPGREGAPTVILQGHLDIVCERDPDSPFDPRAGRIGVVRDGDWLRADGTTLGADNGVAIAAMLALVDDGAPHGPLEFLMTVAEEVGMAGAADLDPELITGRVLLNLDSEEDATLTVGCAGGADSILRLEAPRAAVGPDEVAAAAAATRAATSRPAARTRSSCSRTCSAPRPGSGSRRSTAARAATRSRARRPRSLRDPKRRAARSRPPEWTRRVRMPKPILVFISLLCSWSMA